MDSSEGMRQPRYMAPPAGEAPLKYLVSNPGTVLEQRFPFYDRIEIGRDHEDRPVVPGLLLVQDETISRRHCVIEQAPDGRCYVHDVSRNGTRVDGHRVVPNVETQLRDGQTLTAGSCFEVVLAAGREADGASPAMEVGGTTSVPGYTVATVLVGDIRDYTVLVRTAPTSCLQQSISRLFEMLTEAVQEHGGTVKEYQGDAIFAFWENAMDTSQIISACHAALALDALSRRVAEDRAIWQIADFPLKVDWALSTGPVVIDSFGGRVPTGLSVIGEAVVRAFRIEKFATDETGPIVTCSLTQQVAAGHFRFKDLGEVQAKGFDEREHIFSLIEPL